MCRQVGEERSSYGQRGCIVLSASFGGASVTPSAPSAAEGTLGMFVPDTRAGPAAADVVAIEAPMVDMTVVVPPLPPPTPTITEATADEIPPMDSTLVVLLPSPTLLSSSPTTLAGSSAEATLLVAITELRGRLPPTIAASSPGGVLPAHGRP